MEKRRLKPYHGIIFYVISILALMFPGALMQYYFGIPGLIGTELMYLALAVGYVLLLRGDLKEVFPFRKVRMAAVFGTLLLWIGTFLVVMVLTMILVAFFPEQMLSTSEGLNEAFSTMNVPVQLAVVAFLPAVCEEAVHRGVILNSFRPIKSKWIAIIGVGILFGVNHLDIWRLIPTAVLGIALTYVVYETDNLWYGVLLHFVNNGFATIASSGSDPGTVGEGALDGAAASMGLINSPQITVMSIGVYMLMASVTPFLIYTAAYLVRLGKEDAADVKYFPEKNKGWILGTLIGLTVCLLLGGFVLLFGSMISIAFQVV